MPPTKADYAKINIGCKQLGIHKHDLLHDKYGLESSKDLTPAQTVGLIEHLKRKGAVFTGKGGKDFKRVKPGPAARQQRYILAMWNALGYDIAKLDTRVKKQFGVERFEWVTEHADLHVLITDLEARCDRAGIDYKRHRKTG